MAAFIAKALGFSRDDRHPGRLRQWLNPWMLSSGLLVAVLLLPILYLIWRMFDASGTVWLETAAMMRLYLLPTLVLLLAVGAVTLVIGVGTAWVVTVYAFPLRRFLAWALILPLALPSYIVGITYLGLLDFTGPVQQSLRAVMGRDARLWFNIDNIAGVIFVLSLTLYPYVYLISRASFLRQSGAVLEISRLMGRSSLHGLLRIVLPLAWPAIFGGLMLVFMEVLNDYGVAAYYGIDTVTVGIFRTWDRNEIPTAISFATCILFIVLAVVAIERLVNRRLRHRTATAGYRPVQPIRLHGWRGALAIGVCVLPVLAGFAVPVSQLIAWAALTWRDVLGTDFLRVVRNSLTLAASVTVVTVFCATLIVYTARLYRQGLAQSFSRLAVLSYVLPGAILAVGVGSLVNHIDHRLVDLMVSAFGQPETLILNGTAVAVTFGCVVRFMAVGINPLEAGFERICGRYDEASRVLGASPWRTLWQVDLPLLKGTLAAAAILVFVDTMKELPLTLFLRASNSADTLAVRAFVLASEEQVPESAVASLIILAAGLIPVSLMNTLLLRTDA